MYLIYKDIRVDRMARATSANPGDPCTSVSPSGGKQVSKNPPNYSNPYIVRKISKEVKCTPTQAEELLKDASNFLWLSAQTNGTTVPSPVIDEAWHVFVLFTKEYTEFCDQYCGGYVHHAPHVGPELRMSIDYVSPTVDKMYELFGSKVNSNWDYISLLDWYKENPAIS